MGSTLQHAVRVLAIRDQIVSVLLDRLGIDVEGDGPSITGHTEAAEAVLRLMNECAGYPPVVQIGPVSATPSDTHEVG